MQQVALLRDKRSRLVFYTAQNMIKQYPFPFNAFRLRSFRASDAAVAVSEEAKAVLEREGFKKPVYVLPHGVDTEAFRPDEAIRRAARRRFRLEGFVAGYAGRLMAEKGIFDLLEAVESLGPEYRLMVVGDGPQKDEFLGRAAKLGLTDRLTMVGTVAHDEVPGLMPAMDALVLPSRTCPSWKEQFGRVLIEAMACGVPVVGSDSGEIPGTIGQAGLIFPEGDTGALADALSRLRWSPELKESLVAKGLQKAREFGWQAAAQRLGEIFRTMMER
jgi:glycosyltransferase involved in cell wall biosynthesis